MNFHLLVHEISDDNDINNAVCYRISRFKSFDNILIFTHMWFKLHVYICMYVRV